MAEVKEYIPLVRMSPDISASEVSGRGITWEDAFAEAIVVILQSIEYAIKKHSEHLPPSPNFCIRFKLEQEHWNARLVAKIETDD